MNFRGIDIGSRSGKIVVIDQDEKILFSKVIETTGTAHSTYNSLINFIPSEIKFIKSYSLGTGYGRIAIEKDVNETATEITCHYMGAKKLHNKVNTIIDIGGQDSKVIKIENGVIGNFAMNDRCAAGTGRFLEVMVDRLGFTMESFSKLDIKGVDLKPINSTCTVFAESEVVSLMADGTTALSIASSISLMVAQNLFFILKKLHSRAPYVMTGGVSRMSPVVMHLESLIQEKLFRSDKSQIAGALGAALLAKKKYGEKNG